MCLCQILFRYRGYHINKAEKKPCPRFVNITLYEVVQYIMLQHTVKFYPAIFEIQIKSYRLTCFHKAM